MRLRTFPVFLAFLAMGFADAVGPFVSLAKKEFQLSNAVASLIPFVGFVMFGLLSIPMGVFQDKRGKKFVLMLGLVVALIGLLNAAFGLTSFARFLLTVLLVGAGAAILQVSGNPIMRDVSDPGKYARNLSLAQFVKAIGSLSGPMIPVLAAKYFGASWGVIFPIYAVALVVAVAAVAGLRVEEKRSEHQAATLRSCLALLSNGYVLMMVAAIFFYVGAEVSVSAGIPLYLKERFDIDINKVGLLGTGLFFTALTIGRFSGGVILNWIAPRKFFLATCGVSVLALLGLFVPDRTLAVASFFVAGLGFANIFPLVFAIAVEAMPEHTNELSGLMVTAILGGACLPPLMGLVADHSSVQLSFLVPLAAILYIGWTALNVHKGWTVPQVRESPGGKPTVAIAATSGVVLGGYVGFLLRPNTLIGQLPFKTVISRGAYLEGLDRLLVPVAQTSFNTMVAGAIVGAAVGMIIGYLMLGRHRDRDA